MIIRNQEIVVTDLSRTHLNVVLPDKMSAWACRRSSSPNPSLSVKTAQILRNKIAKLAKCPRTIVGI